jgi:hypothetical protein
MLGYLDFVSILTLFSFKIASLSRDAQNNLRWILRRVILWQDFDEEMI